MDVWWPSCRRPEKAQPQGQKNKYSTSTRTRHALRILATRLRPIFFSVLPRRSALRRVFVPKFGRCRLRYAYNILLSDGGMQRYCRYASSYKRYQVHGSYRPESRKPLTSSSSVSIHGSCPQALATPPGMMYPEHGTSAGQPGANGSGDSSSGQVEFIPARYALCELDMYGLSCAMNPLFNMTATCSCPETLRPSKHTCFLFMLQNPVCYCTQTYYSVSLYVETKHCD